MNLVVQTFFQFGAPSRREHDDVAVSRSGRPGRALWQDLIPAYCCGRCLILLLQCTSRSTVHPARLPHPLLLLNSSLWKGNIMDDLGGHQWPNRPSPNSPPLPLYKATSKQARASPSHSPPFPLPYPPHSVLKSEGEHTNFFWPPWPCSHELGQARGRRTPPPIPPPLALL